MENEKRSSFAAVCSFHKFSEEKEDFFHFYRYVLQSRSLVFFRAKPEQKQKQPEVQSPSPLLLIQPEFKIETAIPIRACSLLICQFSNSSVHESLKFEIAEYKKVGNGSEIVLGRTLVQKHFFRRNCEAACCGCGRSPFQLFSNG